MKKIKIGIIGLGQRGKMLLEDVILQMEDVEILAVCDEYDDRAQEAAAKVQEVKGNAPLCTVEYRDVLAIDEIEAVIISTAWEDHIKIAIDAMRAGKYAAMEVGGAYSLDDCWRLVHTSENTGIPCMLLENCCYGQREMMCLNMVKQGIMGEVVHCEGGYHHPLGGEITKGNEIRHYRLRNYTLRNCENYPTHELGPIAKLLNINNGNRMLTLTSMASKSAGLHEYAVAHRGADDPIARQSFAQGDVITTTIRCAGGETITLTLDTSLPRFYSRGFTVHGTKGYYEEATDSVYLDCDAESYDGGEFSWKPNWNNAETRYAKEYDHPLWKAYQEAGVKAGHGGMDWLVLRAFFESARDGLTPPIDVYDAAAWMCISTLSEDSIALGGAPVAIPDFTNGKWIKTKEKKQIENYRLDVIPEVHLD